MKFNFIRDIWKRIRGYRKVNLNRFSRFFRDIWKRIRGYRKVRLIAVNSGQLFVKDEKGRIGYLSGDVSSEQLEGEEFWALYTGEKYEPSAFLGSYSADDIATVIYYQEEEGRCFVKFKKRERFGFLYDPKGLSRLVDPMMCTLSVSYEGIKPLPCFVVWQ